MLQTDARTVTAPKKTTSKKQTEPELGDIAKKVLAARYLIKNEDGEVVESPKQLFERVAKHIADAETNYGGDPEKVWPKFYELLARQEFLPCTPCLVNAGRSNGLGQYSACFVLPIEDTMHDIFTTLRNTAMVHKSGGGTGFSFSRIRPKNDFVASTTGIASGPVSFMRAFDHVTECVKQSGVRRGANMGILRCDHPDILEFIDCKQDTTQITNFNISVGVTNAFMAAVAAEEDYDLINPRNGKVTERINARTVWDKVIGNAWRTGEPGLFFLDRVNSTDPVAHLPGCEIEAPNPCGEVPLAPFNACVTGDTRIYTTKGLRTIEELHHLQSEGRDLPTALSLTASGIWVEQPITKVLDQGTKPIVELSLSGGMHIQCTADHRFLTERGSWIEATELVGDRVRVLDLPAWRFTATPDDEETRRFEMFGWVTGDGSVLDYTCGVLFGDDDADAQERIEPVFRDFIDGHHLKTQHRRDHTTQIYSEKASARERFFEYGFKPATALEKSVPTCVWTAAPYLQAAYLRGLFSADGTVQLPKGGNNRVAMLATSSPLLADEVQQLLLSLGIQSRQAWTVFSARDGKTRNPQCRVIISASNVDRFADLVGFIVACKTEALYTRTPKHKGSIRQYMTVEGIEAVGEATVYDLAMPVHHNFVANGLVAHNCTLGSINLAKFVISGCIDSDRLAGVARLATRFLDNVLDQNKYPVAEMIEVTRNHRKIGLGVMGWADALVKLGIPYGSDEALQLADHVMETVNAASIAASEALALERNEFPLFEKSKLADGTPRRNATTTVIAPTGSISIIAECSGGIEPLFALCQVRNQADMQMVDFSPLFKDVAQQEGFWSENVRNHVMETGSVQDCLEVPAKWREVFKTANEIAVPWHVKMQAAFQRHVQDATSKTINLHQMASVEEVEEAYQLAWNEGCKGITVYRDKCRPMQTLSAGTKMDKAAPELYPLPTKPYPNWTQAVSTPEGKLSVKLGEDRDTARLFEVWLEVSRAGTTVNAYTEAIARMASLVMRIDSPIEPTRRVQLIIEQLTGLGGKDVVGFGSDRILSLPDGAAKGLRILLADYEARQAEKEPTLVTAPGAPLKAAQGGNGKNGSNGRGLQPQKLKFVSSGDICPSCKNLSLYHAEGCATCRQCGFSKC